DPGYPRAVEVDVAEEAGDLSTKNLWSLKPEVAHRHRVERLDRGGARVAAHGRQHPWLQRVHRAEVFDLDEDRHPAVNELEHLGERGDALSGRAQAPPP